MQSSLDRFFFKKRKAPELNDKEKESQKKKKKKQGKEPFQMLQTDSQKNCDEKHKEEHKQKGIGNISPRMEK